MLAEIVVHAVGDSVRISAVIIPFEIDAKFVLIVLGCFCRHGCENHFRE